MWLIIILNVDCIISLTLFNSILNKLVSWWVVQNWTLLQIQIDLDMENNVINLYKTLKWYANYRDKLFYDEVC